jgi:hypothetical protein
MTFLQKPVFRAVLTVNNVGYGVDKVFVIFALLIIAYLKMVLIAYLTQEPINVEAARIVCGKIGKFAKNVSRISY